MPKVLRIFNRLIVGGPVLNVTYLTKYLSPEFETLLIVGEKEASEKSAQFLADRLGITYITVPEMVREISPLNDYRAYKKLKAIIKEFQPDIVHTHTAKPGALGRLAAASCKVPIIIHTYHGHVFHSYFTYLKSKLFINIERIMNKKTDIIIAISEEQKKELVQDFNIAPIEKFRVVEEGFNLDMFQENKEAKRIKFRNEFGLTEDVIAIGIIGRLVPIKNHQLFLKALDHVLKHTSKKVKAFIVGDGERNRELKALAEKANIKFTDENNIIHPHPLVFTSWRSDIDYIMAGLDIVTLTSFNEGIPVSLIEAQATDRPIVSTRVGGIQDIVVNGETGLLSNTNDMKGFCDNLLKVVEDDALRTRLGTDSRKNVKDRFNYIRLVKDMSGLYNELLERYQNKIKRKKKSGK